MTKKILLYIDGMNSGGAQRQLIGLACCIKKLPDYEARLLFYKKDADFYKSQLEDFQIDYFYDRSSDSKWHGLKALRKQIKVYQPDLIISFLGENNLFACLNRLVCHIPLIVSERNTTILPSRLDRVRFFLYRWADRIVPNSYSQGKYLCGKQQRIANKVFPIVNFVDTNVYHPIDKHKVGDIRHIIVAARVVPQKNVIDFIHAIKVVIDKGNTKFHIDWIGNLGVHDYVKECQSLIEDLKLSEYITFVGECKDMASAYQKADAFCLPSYYEGTPNVICEAMASGLPVLCSDVCDNARYVENGVNGLLFNPHTIRSIADVLVSFINKKDDSILEMGKNSREKAVISFSIDKFNAQWHEQIKQLIG